MQNFNFDAFSSGQIGSKLWLAEKLETHFLSLNTQRINKLVVCGSWYGILGLVLLLRDNIKIQHIINIDIDADAIAKSRKIYDFWIYKNWIGTNPEDPRVDWVDSSKDPNYANTLIKHLNSKDIFVNTSTEHMSKDVWWPLVQIGANVVIQSCNMKHPDHLFPCETLDHLVTSFPLQETFFKGELPFDYPDGNEFKRFMVIGKK